MPDPQTVTMIFAILSFLCTAYVIKIMNSQLTYLKEKFDTVTKLSEEYERMIKMIKENQNELITNKLNAQIHEILGDNNAKLKQIIEDEVDNKLNP